MAASSSESAVEEPLEVLYLVCLTASGGVPLFTRTKGTDKPLAFAEIGMLNGVNMFGQNHGVTLKSTITEEAKIVWKTFHESINIVVVTGDDLANDLHLNRLLDQVFKAMTLLVGIEDLINIKNVERLKKDLRVPHRLLTFQLLSGVEVCVICGPTPSLGEVEAKLLGQCWKPAVDSLRAAYLLTPRNFPATTLVDDDILGVLLVNTNLHKSLSTVHINPGAATPANELQQPINFLSRRRRRRVLRTFYKTTIGSIFPPVHSPPVDEKELYDLNYTRLPHKAKETYMCSEEFKCYAIQNDRFQFFLLFSPSTPTFAMRTIAKKTLATLSKDKIFEEKKKAT